MLRGFSGSHPRVRRLGKYLGAIFTFFVEVLLRELSAGARLNVNELSFEYSTVMKFSLLTLKIYVDEVL